MFKNDTYFFYKNVFRIPLLFMQQNYFEYMKSLFAKTNNFV